MIDELRTAIRDSTFTQAELAKRSGLSQSVISDFASGKTEGATIEKYLRLMQILGFHIRKGTR